MGFLDALGNVIQALDESVKKEMARIEEEKRKYINYTDQQVLNELKSQQTKEGWARSELKIKALKKLLEERGYVYVGNGFYQK